MPTPDFQTALPVASAQVKAPKLPKDAAELGKAVLGPTQKPANETAVEGQVAEPSAEDSLWQSPWIWAVLPLVLGAVAVLALRSWKKRRSAQASPAAPEAPGVDLWSDWRGFQNGLPRRMRRVLDDFQPVIVLGSTASEKERLVQQLSGFAENERLFPRTVSYSGAGLQTFLGTQSLVLAPTEQFLGEAGSSSNPSWHRVLRRICRVHAPRIVVCLAQHPLDSGDLDQVTLWMQTLRAHLDAIMAIRNEDLEVSVVLAQAPGTRPLAASGMTDALFELLYLLSENDPNRAMLHVSLADYPDAILLNLEARREHGSRWLDARLAYFSRDWPRLLARPEHTSAEVLALARLIEELPQLAAVLGGGLAELVTLGPQQRHRSRGVELVFFPTREGHLLGYLAAFEGPRDESASRWHPSTSMLHRIGVATGVALLCVVMMIVYVLEQGSWDSAAAAAAKYRSSKESAAANASDAPEASGTPDAFAELATVLRYVRAETHSVLGLYPGFFDHESLRCTVVDGLRAFLRAKMAKAIRNVEEPETVLQLAALYATGAPNDCGIPQDSQLYARYDQLSRVILDNAEDWSVATGLHVDELRDYLNLACPQVNLGSSDLGFVLSFKFAGEKSWRKLPNVVEFAETLQESPESCDLTKLEAQAMRLKAQLPELEEGLPGDSGDDPSWHGATYSVLQIIKTLDTPAMKPLAKLFQPQEGRLRALANLDSEYHDLAILIRDVQPYLQLGEASATPASDLSELEEAIRAYTALDTELTEDPEIRLSLAGQTFVIDRNSVRAGLLTWALARLQSRFVEVAQRRAGLESTVDVVFFEEDQVRKRHILGVRARSDLTMKGDVPWSHTLEGFRQAVELPMAATSQLLLGLRCAGSASGAGSDPRATPENFRQISAFLDRSAREYVDEYRATWTAVHDSFAVVPGAPLESRLTAVLEELSRTNSPLLGLMREVSRQTDLQVDASSPFADAVSDLREQFAPVTAAVEAKSAAEYQALVSDVLAIVQGDAAKKAAPAKPQEPPSAASVLEAEASGPGRVVLLGLANSEQDPRERVRQWLERAGMPASLRRPWLAPFQAVHSAGMANLEGVLRSWWRERGQELRSRLLGRFPFDAKSGLEVAVDEVVAWLEPAEGRLVTEILPVSNLVTQCTNRPCPALPAGMAETVERMQAIQRAFFAESGEPQALAVSLLPIPFGSQPFAPQRWSLVVGSERKEYYNTAPRPMVVAVPWNDSYTASLEVQLVGSGGALLGARPVAASASPWALFRLLRAARLDADATRATWTLDVEDNGSRRGEVEVRAELCVNATRCSGLFEQVFEW